MSFFDERVVPLLKDGTDVNLVKTEFEKEIATQAMNQVPNVIKNKEEILAEKKQLQTEFKEFKERYAPFEESEITFEAFSEMKSELEALKASGNDSGELTREKETEIYERGKKAAEEALTPKLKQFETKVQEFENQNQELNNKYVNFRAQKEVLTALDKMGVEHNKFWLDGFMNNAKIDYNPQEDKLDISVFHESGYIPLADWETLFPETELGKKMRKAPVNTGGGANGGSSKGGALTLEDTMKIGDRNERLARLKELGYTD